MYKKAIRRIQSSINAKFLVTFLLLLIFPFILLTQAFTYHFRSVLIQKEREYANEKINIAYTQLNRIFSDMNNGLVSLILNRNVTDMLREEAQVPSYEWFQDYKSMQDILQTLGTTADHQYQITVISADSNVYQNGAYYNSSLTMDSEISRFILSHNGNPVMFNRTLEGFDDTPVIALGKAVYQQGNCIGIILIELPVSYIENLLDPFKNQDTRLYILQSPGSLLYTSSPGLMEAELPLLLNAVNNRETSLKLDNARYLLLENEMVRYGISILSLISYHSVFQASNQLLIWFFLGYALIILLTVWGIIKLIFLFSKDIRTLNDEVSRFGTDADTRMNLKVHSRDEVGQLTEGVIAMSKRIQLLMEQIKENERNKRILEFQTLQAQINPHMIYNTLNTITYLAELQNISNIQEISSSFTELLRTISKSRSEFLTIREEVEYIKAYINIKKYNLLNEIHTSYQIDDDVMDCRILKLLLQPIVENAIIHGFSDLQADAALDLRIYQEHGRVLIDIIDNGSGMDEETRNRILCGEETAKNTFLSVGIHNIMERLRLQYEEGSVFRIVSFPGEGTSVHIEFPAETDGGITNDSCFLCR